MQLGTDWATVKAFATARSIGVQYVATPDTYYIWAIDGQAELATQISIVSPSAGDQLDFETNFMPTANASPVNSVRTQFEQVAYLLQMSHMSILDVAPRTTGTATLQIPGTFGGLNPPANGRYIDEGMAWFTPGCDGDIVTQIAIVDNDNILGQGAGFVCGTYCDTQVPTANQGWALHPVFPTEVSTLGWYGFIPSGLYLVIAVTRSATATVNGNFYCNIKWGMRT
jgi:hypothetical protein